MQEVAVFARLRKMGDVVAVLPVDKLRGLEWLGSRQPLPEDKNLAQDAAFGVAFFPTLTLYSPPGMAVPDFQAGRIPHACRRRTGSTAPTAQDGARAHSACLQARHTASFRRHR